MLKAAQIATTEPGPDAAKRIHQRHFVQGMEEVVAGTSVMAQSLFDENGGPPPAGFVEEMSEGQEALRAELALVVERIDGLERRRPTRCRSSTTARPRRLPPPRNPRRRGPGPDAHPVDRPTAALALAAAVLARRPASDRLTV